MTDTAKPKSLKSKIKLLISALLVGLVLVFMLLNMDPTEVNLIFAKVTMRRAFMIVAVFLVGFLAGWLGKSAFWRRNSNN